MGAWRHTFARSFLRRLPEQMILPRWHPASFHVYTTGDSNRVSRLRSQPMVVSCRPAPHYKRERETCVESQALASTRGLA
jgi:hypothetical protein